MYTVISKDGTKIAYDKVGQGPALVMVAGAFSYRKFPGQVQLANLLSEHFTVYNYDRRGRGDSGDAQPYDIAREIEDLEAILDEAGGSAFVWGLSSGAVLALRAAASGLNIKKLALHEPPFVVDATDPKPPENFVSRVTELIAADRREEAVKYFMTKGMGAPTFVVTMMKVIPGVWSNLLAVAHTLPYDATLLEAYIGGNSLSSEEWRTVTMPTIVLEGTESPASLRHASRALANVLPNANLISKKGLGHTKKLNTKMIASELNEFFMEKIPTLSIKD
ncbi:alpha/beta fold hydrolase [Lederbergia citri]|uniref:Alpha/beta hydrolase n=1 Tax=Lederbergia citri TaxID=2833580 RepID=A0A942TGJ1_9BACI|nr:alpha/beta hydrolase [Lederbergia citri]MBS4196498.1 alpha/beta hydrolase [Lederbergia citri]